MIKVVFSCTRSTLWVDSEHNVGLIGNLNFDLESNLNHTLKIKVTHDRSCLQPTSAKLCTLENMEFYSNSSRGRKLHVIMCVCCVRTKRVCFDKVKGTKYLYLGIESTKESRHLCSTVYGEYICAHCLLFN